MSVKGYEKCNSWNSTVAQFRKLNPGKSFKECLVGAKPIWKKMSILNGG